MDQLFCICGHRFELVPLAELGGRPRVDVLCNMSGIFRDSFQNVVELLDDLFQRAAAADEPPEQNYIRCVIFWARGCRLLSCASA